MKKIKKFKVLDRKLHLEFDDGQSGDLYLTEEFKNVTQPLNDPAVFSTAKIIDDGFGIGFENCEYDICAQYVYKNISPI